MLRRSVEVDDGRPNICFMPARWSGKARETFFRMSQPSAPDRVAVPLTNKQCFEPSVACDMTLALGLWLAGGIKEPIPQSNNLLERKLRYTR